MIFHELVQIGCFAMHAYLVLRGSVSLFDGSLREDSEDVGKSSIAYENLPSV